MSTIRYTAPPAPPFVLGLDPGLETGLAGFVPEGAGRLAFVASAAPLDALRYLRRWARQGRLLTAYVEDARDLGLYARHRTAEREERDRIARGVGHVDCLTTLYLEALGRLGVPAVTVTPGRGPKWDAAELARLTGYEGPSNEHGRDAARLAYGKRALDRADS